MEYDVFICHASEDKDFVEPLAHALKDKDLRVWYDRFELKIGDGLRQKIDHGLTNSRYGIVVLSKAFFAKPWPQSELDALATRQNTEGRKVILPIWHEIGADDVKEHSPLLASLLAARSGDGLDSVVGQIETVCSGRDTPKARSVFQTSDEVGLRERCLDVIRRGEQSEWVKLVDELQSPIEDQLIAWKQHGEIAIQQNADAWRKAVLKATEICMPGFLPLFASVEAGQKERWEDATCILRRLALLEKKMRAGAIEVINIGLEMLYVPGNIGMAIAVETRQHDFIWDWMLLPMPGYAQAEETKWGEIRYAFWSPFGNDFREPFRSLLDLYDSQSLRGFFPSKERMKEWLFKANLLQSIVELRLLARTQEGSEIVEKRDTGYKPHLKVAPFWCMIEPSHFGTWTWDLFGSGDDFIRFFLQGAQGHVDRMKIWNWWKGWKTICHACLDEVTRHSIFLRTEWLMLPGEPAGKV